MSQLINTSLVLVQPPLDRLQKKYYELRDSNQNPCLLKHRINHLVNSQLLILERERSLPPLSKQRRYSTIFVALIIVKIALKVVVIAYELFDKLIRKTSLQTFFLAKHIPYLSLACGISLAVYRYRVRDRDCRVVFELLSATLACIPGFIAISLAIDLGILYINSYQKTINSTALVPHDVRRTGAVNSSLVDPNWREKSPKPKLHDPFEALKFLRIPREQADNIEFIEKKYRSLLEEYEPRLKRLPLVYAPIMQEILDCCHTAYQTLKNKKT